MPCLSQLLLATPLWTCLHRLGGPGLILVGIIDGFVIPVPGSVDVFLIVLSSRQPEWWPYYALMATIGAVAGGYVSYALAEEGGRELLERKLGKRRAEKLTKPFERRGFATVAIASLLPPPFPTIPLLLTAGALQYPARKFLAALSFGRAVRYFVLGFLAHLYGERIFEALSPYYRPILYVLICLAILGGITVFAYFKWCRPRKQREKQAHGEERKSSMPWPGREKEDSRPQRRRAN